MNVTWKRLLVVCVCAGLSVTLAFGCSISSDDPDSPLAPTGITSYNTNSSWSCATGVSCQDVYDFTMTAGSVITVGVSNVTGNSVSQLALYGPGIALGGNNLLTGTNSELRCTSVASCSGYAAGEQKTGVILTQTGTYRVAVTRDWGKSCGSSGNYRLDLTSSIAFQAVSQSVNNGASAAPGAACL